MTRNSRLLKEGIDLLDYDEQEYTPQSIRNIINMNDKKGARQASVETSKFINALKQYINDAGYSFPEAFWDSIEQEAYDGDMVGIDNLEDLKMFNNFTLKDALMLLKRVIQEVINNGMYKEFGLPEDTTSIEDFKGKPYGDIIKDLFDMYDITNLEEFKDQMNYSDLIDSMCERLGGVSTDVKAMTRARRILEKYAADYL
jgi:hypothetical protein